MATPNRILSLDFGTQTVGLAEFHAGKDGGLVLANYQSSELLADPAVDSTRLAQAKISIGELVAARALKGAKVNYTVSAQSVFTRFVKLPSVGEEQVEQIVTFEAQQNVPFPIDEVVWDYQLVDQGNSAEVEVVLVAIKADLLDEVNDAVEGSGLATSIVDVSPMALYNAYRYNYSDVHDCALLIDIGARTTNLIFVEPRKVFIFQARKTPRQYPAVLDRRHDKTETAHRPSDLFLPKSARHHRRAGVQNAVEQNGELRIRFGQQSRRAASRRGDDQCVKGFGHTNPKRKRGVLESGIIMCQTVRAKSLACASG